MSPGMFQSTGAQQSSVCLHHKWPRKPTLRFNPYQDRHALPLTPVVELKGLSAKWISNLPLWVQSVSDEGLSQRLGFNPMGQIDSSKHEFTLKSNSEGRRRERRERWRKMELISVNVQVWVCVGVSALWVNLFFQTPLHTVTLPF